MKNYLEQVKEDIKTWIEENGTYYFNVDDYKGNREDFEEFLNDELWIVDSVTGNGSGSYFCNTEEAKENVLNDINTVLEALEMFCTTANTIAEKFLTQDWDFFDVTARCYVLNQAIYEICDELEEQGMFDELEEEDEEEEDNIITDVAAAVRKAVDTFQNEPVKEPEIA